LSLWFGLPCAVALGLGAHFALSLFGAGYASTATWPMQLLVFGYLPNLPKIYYIAVCRAAGQITRAAVVLTTFAAIEVIAEAIGGVSGVLTGLAIALLIVSVIEGLVTAPAVIRAVAGRGRQGLTVGVMRREGA
jgi:hypothetical protein